MGESGKDALRVQFKDLRPPEKLLTGPQDEGKLTFDASGRSWAYAMWEIPDQWSHTMSSTIERCIGSKVASWISSGRQLDCADVALTALAECAEAESKPLALDVWDSSQEQWKTIRSNDFASISKFAEKIRSEMGAVNLFDRDRVTSAKKLDSLDTGDLLVWDLRSHGGQYTGHTMVVLSNDPANRRVEVGEGHLSEEPSRSVYTYTEIMNKWEGPVKGKGRAWNWSRLLREPYFFILGTWKGKAGGQDVTAHFSGTASHPSEVISRGGIPVALDNEKLNGRVVSFTAAQGGQTATGTSSFATDFRSMVTRMRASGEEITINFKPA